jgi:hypothetical protein
VEISGTFYPQNLSWRDPCTCCYLIILLQLHRVPTPPLHADKEPLTQIHTADLNPLSLLPIIFTSMSVCASIWFTWHHTACLTQTIPPNSLTSHHHFLPLFPSWHHRLNCDFLFTSSQDAVHCDMLPIATTFSKYLPSQAFQHDGQ